MTGGATPSASLIAQLRDELQHHLPFSRMDAADVERFVHAAELRYYPAGAVVAQPEDGDAATFFCVRRGAVVREAPPAEAPVPLRLEAGDLFPIGAVLGSRPVRGRYRSDGDTFVLALPAREVQRLAAEAGPLADFLQGRLAQWLAASQQRLRDSYAAEVLAEHGLATPLSALVGRHPVLCAPEDAVRDALEAMQSRGVGSVVVAAPDGAAQGILTRHDLPRLMLGAATLDEPVRRWMSQPVRSLDADATADDAAQLMARFGIRHVPVTRGGAVVGVVSERDLFALQRLSIGQLGASIAAARDAADLRRAGEGIRRFAGALAGQGVQARQLTAILSGLNDRLTRRVIALEAQRHGLDLGRVCWLALGSEGRSEQTIATDQDNALVVADDAPGGFIDAARAFGRAVNLALADCGFPLCRGGIMAGEPDGCASWSDWRARFAQWIAHGTPENLLRAAIYFDLRPLAGDASLAHRLQDEAVAQARATPRFLKQLALQSLAHEPPLGWLGGLDAGEDGSIDLKLQGSAIFVEAARVNALACGLTATSTRERLEGAGRAAGVPPAEYEGWVVAHEFLLQLRLRAQLAGPGGNRIRVDALNDVDRRILREALRSARLLQHRLRLDYDR